MKKDVKINGYTVKITEDGFPESPRERDNFGTMVCFHSRYKFGDEQPDNVDDWREQLALELDPTLEGRLHYWRDGEGYTRIASRNDNNWQARCDAVRECERGLINDVLDKRTVMLPLYLHDHGGIAMNTTGFSCGWDSGQVGYIYATRERILKEYGKKYLTQKLRESVENVLRAEVEIYDRYIGDDIWRFDIEDDEGRVVHTCGGYPGYVRCEDDAIAFAESLPPKVAHLYLVRTPQIDVCTAATSENAAIELVAAAEGCPMSCLKCMKLSDTFVALKQTRRDIEMYLSGEWDGSAEGWQATLDAIDGALKSEMSKELGDLK